MQRLIICLVFLLASVPHLGKADGEPAGEFDYYVLALSWSPNWCALEGDAREAAQCEQNADYGWTLHGLWPQYQQGYPAYCNTPNAAPSRHETAGMADIMGSSGLAWHQWKKHGRCSGLTATEYFAVSRRAYGSVVRPSVFRKLKTPITLPAAVVEEAFLKDNPDLTANGVTITCKGDFIQEVRICLTRDLDPVPCGRDVIKDCSLENAGFTPVR